MTSVYFTRNDRCLSCQLFKADALPSRVTPTTLHFNTLSLVYSPLTLIYNYPLIPTCTNKIS